MLKVVSRKFFPLLSLVAVTTGCGKKITEPVTEPVQVVENQELPPTVTLEVKSAVAKKASFKIPKNCILEIPKKLLVKGDSAFGKRIEITYNMLEEFREEYGFKCLYKSAGTPTELKLESCKDSFGGNFGDISGNLEPMDKDKLIQMEILEPHTTNLTVSALFQVDWK